MALALVLAFRYYMHPVPVVPPQTFLTQDTAAFVFVHVDPAVPLTMETAADVVMQPETIASMPTKPGEKITLDRKKAIAYISSFTPLQCVVIMQPSEKEDATHGGLALSVHRGSRFLSALVRKGIGEGFSAYEGAELATLDKDVHLAIRLNNYMSADRDELIKAWVGSLKAERQREEQPGAGQPPAPNISPALKTAYGRLDTGLPLVFASLNEHGELASLAALITDPDGRRLIQQTGVAAEGVVSLAGQIKPLSPRDAELTLLIDCGDAGAAEALKDRLAAAVRNTGDKWPLEASTISVEAPGVVQVKGRINDLPAKVARLVVDVTRRAHQMREGGPQPQAPHPPPPAPTSAPADAPSLQT